MPPYGLSARGTTGRLTAKAAEQPMSDFNQNVWAPWRMEYIRSMEDHADDVGCFLCNYWQHPEDDDANFVIWRRRHVLVVMNRFPYTNGHLLIAPATHEGDLLALGDETLHALQQATRQAVQVLSTAVRAQGFNVGYNLGRCAGAGLPEHLHAHVVPRWNADTNYMAVVGNVRVIPDALEATYRQLTKATDELGLRQPDAEGKDGG
jgi:ATP adenylyltransferase